MALVEAVRKNAVAFALSAAPDLARVPASSIFARAIRTIRARLSRETSTGLFIPEVDGLRFVAVLSVFAFHLNAYLQLKSPAQYGADTVSLIISRLFAEGKSGVQLFFVISGLILSLAFAAHHLQ